jgi:aldehyde dehydrogenase (NAD+)
LANNGQTCFLGTRVLAPQNRYSEIVDVFTAFAGSMAVGESLEAGTQIGPMASERQRDRVEDYIAKEEIFGPVLSVIPYRDDANAVRIANDSDFGLGGTVWTGDPDRGRDVARRVATGSIGYLPDPAAPCGGVEDSGIGRELGPEGLASYQQLKSIYG